MAQRGDSRNLILIHLHATEHVKSVVAEGLAFRDGHRCPSGWNSGNELASTQNGGDAVNHLGAGKIATMDGHNDVHALPDQILDPVGPLRQQFERPALASDLIRSHHVKILGAMRHQRDVVVAAGASVACASSGAVRDSTNAMTIAVRTAPRTTSATMFGST